ncbi:hypothetical protein A605_12315 [Corynebacterium halotolerans YIM 70093 = DSM 44683]|uniref:Uncharacterized protein n=2 Tax=Corynebacterium halotolerans TaxID=225326 RepID=M1N0H1_9CORY|nr:hypothetical protein A605_12315 [Corynebacterium halotolerans YIM 70093 = DSM 44683]
MITARMWTVVLVLGLLGAGLMSVGLPPQIGAALLTLAVLVAPPAVIASLAWLMRAPATRIPRWLLWVGGAGTVLGLGWLIAVPGQNTAIIIFALGVWVLVVGILSMAVLSIAR